MSEKRKAQFDALMETLSTHMSPEQLATVKSTFETVPEAMYVVGEQVMARNESARIAQEYQQRQAALETERVALANLANKVNEYESYLATNSVTRAEYDQLQAEKAIYQQQLDHLKAQYPELGDQLGASANSLAGTPNNGGMNMNTNPNGGAHISSRPENPIKPVSELQFNQQMNQAVALAAMSPAVQHDLAEKHRQLFPNQPLTNMTALVQESMATGKPLEEIWSEQYKVPERVEALNKERFEHQVNQRVEEEIAKRIGAGIVSGNIGGANAEAHTSPFLQGLNVPIDQRQGPAGAPDPNRIANQGTGQGTAAQAATAAYLAGKYKGERVEL